MFYNTNDKSKVVREKNFDKKQTLPWPLVIEAMHASQAKLLCPLVLGAAGLGRDAPVLELSTKCRSAEH